MDGTRFLGLCIVAAALCLSAAIVTHALLAPQPQPAPPPAEGKVKEIGRYQFHPTRVTQDNRVVVLDTITGEVWRK
jgi:hypothetical protein